MLCLVTAVLYGVLRAAMTWRAPLATGTRVVLDLWHLPLYAALSTLRMALAYILSLVFSLAYAKIAAGSRTAERFMLPLLDILQSIPILSFMPGVVLALAALFPGRALGLELAAILLIFTSQAWNLAFGFHQSLLTIPQELGEAARVYRLGMWRRFTRLELPFGAISLIANSMMSWAGGWFFLIAAEEFTLGDKNFELPGLGSYLKEATDAGNTGALVLGLLTLVVIIVSLDQLLWRPLVAWSDRFKLEQSGAGDVPQSGVLDALQGSDLVQWLATRFFVPAARALDDLFSRPRKPRPAQEPDAPRSGWRRFSPWFWGIVMLAGVIGGAAASVRAVAGLGGSEWKEIAAGAGATFLRTLVALILAAAWTVPVGVAIGMNPRWAHRAQPIVQVIASVPATAVFPLLYTMLLGVPGGLSMAAILLMLLGTQWYVLFNVIAGAMAIPSDLREAAVTYGVTGWRRWRTLILPAIFPYLVTGMLTATGGAWNASIVSELITINHKTYSTVGLGSLITGAANKQNFAVLLAGTLVMAGIVITCNRLVWRRLYALAATRYRLD
jgi:NitT/TauT family transport system permease protein